MAQAYRGAIGRTQTAIVHVTDPGGQLVAVQVYTSVDAAGDPELGDQLQRDALNVVRMDGGASLRVAVPVLYHDPAAEVMVLVLGDAHRHRELEERIAVLEQLRVDPATVPAYAKDFGVVFGGAGLRAYLAQRAHPREVAVEPGDDPLTTELTDLPIAPPGDTAPGDLEARAASGCHVDRDGVHLVVIAGDPIARGLTGALDVRVVLHRTPSYPVVALVVGPPAAMRTPAMSQLVVVPFDVAAERDRGVLLELARMFALTVDLVTDDRSIDFRSASSARSAEQGSKTPWEEGTPGGGTRGHRVRRCRLIAPLAENVAYIVRAADAHLRGIAADGAPDHGLARALVLDAGFDLLGIAHPERAEFRADKLAQIATAQQLRRALASARRFTRPAREAYLACTRSFPLPRWRQLRRDILARAVAWGLWMGPELAQLAVDEGLVRSRHDLIVQLDRGFERLRHDVAAFDIDADAAADNAAAIAAEAHALGIELRSIRPDATGAIASDAAPVVSGSIDAAPAHDAPQSPEAWSTEQLIAQLEPAGSARDGDALRLAAALALCSRGDPRAAAPVIAAAMQMSRREAVRVLAMAVKFGAAAQPALLEGLTSSKAFLRHGSALALALLRSEDATHAVIALLLSEPTELWREIARAVGQIGGEALAPLVRQCERRQDRAAPVADRVAWAMAHIGVRGGRAAIEAMVGGQGAMAPVAAKALDLLALAAGDHIREPPDAVASGSERDLTVNHAFSRQFFDVLDRDFPERGMERGTEGGTEGGIVEQGASEAVEP